MAGNIITGINNQRVNLTTVTGYNYNRTYILTINTPNVPEIKISALRIKFSIVRNVDSTANIAMINIYNLADSTIGTIKELETKVKLSVGYGVSSDSIFIGEVRKFYKRYLETDRVLSIVCGDGEAALTSSYFTRTYQSNVGVEVIINDIASSFDGINIGSLEGITDGTFQLSGVSLSKSSKEIMDDYADAYGFEWSIQDGEVVTTNVGVPLSTEVTGAYKVVSKETGLIGFPERTDTGIEFTALMSSNFKPNHGIIIRTGSGDDQKTGTFKILEAKHVGDNYGKDWTTRVLGERIEQS